MTQEGWFASIGLAIIGVFCAIIGIENNNKVAWAADRLFIGPLLARLWITAIVG